MFGSSCIGCYSGAVTAFSGGLFIGAPAEVFNVLSQHAVDGIMSWFYS